MSAKRNHPVNRLRRAQSAAQAGKAAEYRKANADAGARHRAELEQQREAELSTAAPPVATPTPLPVAAVVAELPEVEPGYLRPDVLATARRLALDSDAHRELARRAAQSPRQRERADWSAAAEWFLAVGLNKTPPVLTRRAAMTINGFVRSSYTRTAA